MAHQGGDGFIRCDLGHQHWGRFGAAGLLGYARDDSGQTRVLLQHRSWWTSYGGTWGLFGGARQRHEPAALAALRETAEESTLPGDIVRVRGVLRDDHGGWAYETVIGELPQAVPVEPASRETVAAAWVSASAVEELTLHPGLAAQWPVLRTALLPIAVIVDAANVVGARADGWWRDRPGAAARLRDELCALGARGLTSLPEGVAVPQLDVWFPEIVLVVEGAARAGVTAEFRGPGSPAASEFSGRDARHGARGDRVQDRKHDAGRRAEDIRGRRSRRDRARATSGGPELAGSVGGPGSTRVSAQGPGLSPGAAGERDVTRAYAGGLAPGAVAEQDRVRIVAATAAGDDAIAELARTEPGIRLVVTADRELRRRCEDVGAAVVGPRWLLKLL